MLLEIDEIQKKLEKRGIRFNRAKKEANATRPFKGVLGINTLGLLEHLRKEGYSIQMPPYRYYSVR